MMFKIVDTLKYNRVTIILNSSLTFIWWIAFNPGFFAPDSLGTLNMVKSGEITSEYTQIWGVVVNLISLGGSEPQLSTLFFSQLLSISFSLFAIQIFDNRSARYSTFFMHLTPTFGAMSVTLWHDIPSAAGFFLALTGLLSYRKYPRYSKYLIAVGFFFASFRYNGLITIALCGSAYALFSKQKKLLTFTTISALVMGLSFYSLDVNNAREVNAYSDGAVNWMRYDISCYASKGDEKSDEFITSNFGSPKSVDFWESSNACTWFNTSEAWLNRNDMLNHQVRRAWFNLLLQDPIFVIKTHLRRHSYLVPVPVSGLPRPPFIHTKIDANWHHLSFTFPTLAEKARIFPRSWNYLNFIFAWAGMWLAITLGIGLKRRNTAFLLTSGVGLLISVGLLITAAIPDARYALFILLSGQLIFIATVVDIIFTKLKPRNRTAR